MADRSPPILLLLLLCALVAVVSARVRDVPEHCGVFWCPDKCEVAFKGDCPHNCNCGALKRCPLVSCPAKQPICAVYTQLDGCQTCACRLPFVTVERFTADGQPVFAQPEFVFLDAGSSSLDRDRLNDQASLVTGSRSVVSGRFMCTLPYMEKVDDCMQPMNDFRAFTKSRRRDAIDSFNPMLRPRKADMANMCTLYGQALSCMGSKIFDECRHKHPHLAEMDAVYGYPCGGRQNLFMHHLDCYQRAHYESFRIFACEDTALRSLQFIQSGPFELEDKQEQKCQAMNWLRDCEVPTIHRRCSEEAAAVYKESLMAATEYVAPECEMDFDRDAFVRKNDTEETYWTLPEKEELVCADDLQEHVDEHFRPLYDDINRMTRRASVALPIAFAYAKSTLGRRCADYQRSMKAIQSVAKLRCIRRYHLYDAVFYVLDYPCGHGTEAYFFKYFDCLKTAHRRSAVIRCEETASRHLQHPSVDSCETYNIFADCIYDSVVDECGMNGWEMEFQYLAITVRKNVPDCRLKRLFRLPELDD